LIVFAFEPIGLILFAAAVLIGIAIWRNTWGGDRR